MLRVENLNAWYGHTQALFDASIQIDAGRTLALVGTNGAGKTTLVRSILGLTRATGTVRIAGTDVSRVPTRKRASAHGLSVVPEGRGMLNSLTVQENLELGHGRLSSADRAFVDESFAQIGRRLGEKVSNLSGGEQQMVALCRAFLRKPRLLILDEPSLGLAPIIVDRVYDYLKAARHSGTTFLLVEQDVERARVASDAMCFISAGRVLGTVPSVDEQAVTEMVSAVFGNSDLSAGAPGPPPVPPHRTAERLR
jgi:branched-chain amino acid transport system ATP-binding protein